ncbi:MAG: GNAT family N-acetyltransferase [Novipirellula sp. JB048]
MKTHHCDWMTRRDLRRVLQIESHCFPNPWDEPQFLFHLNRSEVRGIVARDAMDGRVIGFAIYSLATKSITIQNLAVAPARQGEGIGSSLVGCIASKLVDRRTTMIVDVCELFSGANAFFRACGMHPTSVIRRKYGNTLDAFRLSYDVDFSPLPLSNLCRQGTSTP